MFQVPIYRNKICVNLHYVTFSVKKFSNVVTPLKEVLHETHRKQESMNNLHQIKIVIVPLGPGLVMSTPT